MLDTKRTILIIENQEFQLIEMLSCLNLYYEVYPTTGDYVRFVDNVRVWVNEQYKQVYRDKALNYINEVVNDKHLNVELILMDHKLGGAHNCKTGIDLAIALNEMRKPTKPILPVIFISKTEHTDKKRIIKFDDYQKKYPNTSEWVHKGYFGDEILEREFIEQNVVTEIDELLKKSLLTRIIEKLNEKIIDERSSTTVIDEAIRQNTETIIAKINNEQITISEEIYDKISNELSKADYNELLKEICEDERR